MTQIVFNSQEEFENAVMEVLEKRLRIKIDAQYDPERAEIFLVDQYSEKYASVITSDFYESKM